MTNEFAIKVLTELRGYGDKFANIGFVRKEALDMAIKALEQKSYKSEARRWKRRYLDLKQRIFKLEEQTNWIPCSERLPEEYICDDGYVEPSDYVLVWGDHGNYGVSRYWGNRKSKIENPNSYKDWVDLEWVVQKPIAWMPLPEPYKRK